MQRLRADLDEVRVQRGAVLHLLHSLALLILGSPDPCLEGTASCFTNENLVIDLMNLQGDGILDRARLSGTRFDVSTRHTVCGADFEELCQWLGDPRSEGRRAESALIDD